VRSPARSLHHFQPDVIALLFVFLGSTVAGHGLSIERIGSGGQQQARRPEAEVGGAEGTGGGAGAKAKERKGKK
jgi:hypothetical protein